MPDDPGKAQPSPDAEASTPEQHLVVDAVAEPQAEVRFVYDGDAGIAGDRA